MYKKAIREKLRFDYKRGPLTTEQLYDLKMTELREVIKNIHAQLKANDVVEDSLAFLEGGANTTAEQKAVELNKLRFEIAKDVYTTRLQEATDERKAYENNKELAKLEEILQRKKDTAIEDMSAEELEKLIMQKREAMK